jgi:hypothetical protein
MSKKKSTWNEPNYLKELIIANCKLYLQGETELKETILSHLKTFADRYHLELRKVAKIELTIAIKRFSENTEGYQNSINILYSAL